MIEALRRWWWLRHHRDERTRRDPDLAWAREKQRVIEERLRILGLDADVVRRARRTVREGEHR